MEVGLNSNKREDEIVFFFKFYFELTSLQVFVLFGIYLSLSEKKFDGLFCLVWVCDVFVRLCLEGNSSRSLFVTLHK